MWTEWNRSAHSLNTKIVKIIQLQILLAKENWTEWNRSADPMISWVEQKSCKRADVTSKLHSGRKSYRCKSCSRRVRCLFSLPSLVSRRLFRRSRRGIWNFRVWCEDNQWSSCPHNGVTLVKQGILCKYYFFLSNKSCNVGPFRQTAPLMCHVIVFFPPRKCPSLPMRNNALLSDPLPR